MSGPPRPPLLVVPPVEQTGPTARQEALHAAATALIETAPEFAALRGAAPTRAEVNPGLDETQRGYLYLRYDVPGSAPQEFWAHVGHSTWLNWRTGQVRVRLDAPPAPTTAGRTPRERGPSA